MLGGFSNSKQIYLLYEEDSSQGRSIFITATWHIEHTDELKRAAEWTRAAQGFLRTQACPQCCSTCSPAQRPKLQLLWVLTSGSHLIIKFTGTFPWALPVPGGDCVPPCLAPWSSRAAQGSGRWLPGSARGGGWEGGCETLLLPAQVSPLTFTLL